MKKTEKLIILNQELETFNRNNDRMYEMLEEEKDYMNTVLLGMISKHNVMIEAILNMIKKLEEERKEDE